MCRMMASVMRPSPAGDAAVAGAHFHDAAGRTEWHGFQHFFNEMRRTARYGSNGFEVFDSSF